MFTFCPNLSFCDKILADFFEVINVRMVKRGLSVTSTKHTRNRFRNMEKLATAKDPTAKVKTSTVLRTWKL